MKLVLLFCWCVCTFALLQGQTRKSGGSADKRLTAVMDVDHVMNAYMTAIGGKKKLDAIRDMTVIYENENSGEKNTSLIRQINTGEGAFFMIEEFVEKERKYKMLIEREKVITLIDSDKQTIEGERATNIYNQTFLLIEPAYSQIGIRPELEGVEKVDGRYAYKVKATFGSTVIYSFYDCESGLKIKIGIALGPGKMQAAYVEDYRKTDGGILYAHRIRRVDESGRTEKINVIASILTNQGLDKSESY